MLKKRKDKKDRERGKGPRRGPRQGARIFRKKVCRFCTEKKTIDFLDFEYLRRFTTERGKIVPSRISGCCAKHQRQLSRAIKRARAISFFSYVSR